MNKVKEGKIIVVVAPSGTGKSTLIKKLKEDFKQLVESTSCTTRPIRKGEIDGVHYFFLSKKEFLQRKNEGEFLEWAIVHNNYYGTSKKFVEKKITEGQSLIFDIDIQGADAFFKYFKKKSHSIFISPPSIKELEKRLTSRGTDTERVIKTRIENAKKEILRKNDYEHSLVNDDLKKTYSELYTIVKNILEE
ncbi:MAG: guanylate kinase [Bacteriovoracaceae bacterium]|nr:guanylate kinase [Bacteriovoracaceae bacterium]